MQQDGEYEFVPLSCNDIDHEGYQIEALCLREECKYSSALCCRCILKYHVDCVDSTKLFEDIFQLLEPFLKIQSDLINLSQKKEKGHQSKFANSIQLILKPINTYFENPNLNELNQLGKFLKQSDKISKEIIYLLEQCKQENMDQSIVLVQNHKTAKDMYEQGKVLFNQQKYLEAIDCFEQALNIDSQYHFAWNGKGAVLQKLNRQKQAIDCFEQAIKINPNFDLAWGNKGTSLNILLKPYQAIECFELALKISSEQVQHWNGKGWALITQTKYEEAFDCYEKALNLDIKCPNSWNGKGEVLYYQKKYKESIKCFEQALQIYPNYSNVWNNKGVIDHLFLGKALIYQKKYQEAIKCYEQAIQINSKYAVAWDNKGVALFNQCKYKLASNCYKKAIEIDPDNIDFQRNLDIANHYLAFSTITLNPNVDNY